MECKTCGAEKNQLGRGVVLRNMEVVPCPDCRICERGLKLSLKYQSSVDGQILAVNY